MTRFFNNLKTAILLAMMFGLILFIGSFWGRQGLIIAFLCGGMMNVLAYFFSANIALATMQAQEVNEQTAPDLVHLVGRLAKNAGLPMPRVYIAPHDAPNAFATGRGPGAAAVCVTQGALRLLSFDELEGVMAHELSHVKNRDTLISCVAATIAGAISFLATMAQWGLIFGGVGGGNNRDREGGLGIIGVLLTIILAPVAAALIQMAISRSREYVADADGARIAGTPWGLINALKKLDATARRVPLEGDVPAFNHLFIVEPFTGESLANLFATHPPVEKRIARLQELA